MTNTLSQVNKKKILVADDEPMVRRVLRKMFSKNFTVLEAEDGKQAMNMARDEKPDLIFMDLIMPEMDGYTSCHIIKTDTATRVIPVLMLSAIDHELNMKLSQKMGADGYITKPFNQRHLLKTVSRLLASSA